MGAFASRAFFSQSVQPIPQQGASVTEALSTNDIHEERAGEEEGQEEGEEAEGEEEGEEGGGKDEEGEREEGGSRRKEGKNHRKKKQKGWTPVLKQQMARHVPVMLHEAPYWPVGC